MESDIPRSYAICDSRSGVATNRYDIPVPRRDEEPLGVSLKGTQGQRCTQIPIEGKKNGSHGAMLEGNLLMTWELDWATT